MMVIPETHGSEILATHLGESWTHHLSLGLAIFYKKITKNVLVYPTRMSDRVHQIRLVYGV